MNVAGLINILIMLLMMNDLILDLQMVLWRKFQKLQIYDLELYYWRDPTRAGSGHASAFEASTPMMLITDA